MDVQETYRDAGVICQRCFRPGLRLSLPHAVTMMVVLVVVVLMELLQECDGVSGQLQNCGFAVTRSGQHENYVARTNTTTNKSKTLQMTKWQNPSHTNSEKAAQDG